MWRSRKWRHNALQFLHFPRKGLIRCKFHPNKHSFYIAGATGAASDDVAHYGKERKTLCQPSSSCCCHFWWGKCEDRERLNSSLPFGLCHLWALEGKALRCQIHQQGPTQVCNHSCLSRPVPDHQDQHEEVQGQAETDNSCRWRLHRIRMNVWGLAMI